MAAAPLKGARASVIELRRVIAKDRHRRAWVVISGIFHGPEPFKDADIPDSLPPSMKECRLRTDRRRIEPRDL
jgi:hypothetical protein